jgi:hypothetical protein
VGDIILEAVIFESPLELRVSLRSPSFGEPTLETARIFGGVVTNVERTDGIGCVTLLEF